jgi:hypothetical protein
MVKLGEQYFCKRHAALAARRVARKAKGKAQ